MTTFQVGTSYTTRFIGDSNATMTALCVKRTAKTVTFEVPEMRETITKRVYELDRCEQCKYANYSMSPVFRADRTL